MTTLRQRNFDLVDQVLARCRDEARFSAAWNPPNAGDIVARKMDDDGRFEYLAFVVQDDPAQTVAEILAWLGADAPRGAPGAS